MPLHVASLGEGVPGAHESVTVPATHEITPDAAHAPTPQADAVATKSSSLAPSQSSSMPSQVASLADGAPGAHESTTDPDTHEVLPDAAQAPTPHVVGCET
jgi:hypothetical protein